MGGTTRTNHEPDLIQHEAIAFHLKHDKLMTVHHERVRDDALGDCAVRTAKTHFSHCGRQATARTPALTAVVSPVISVLHDWREIVE